MIKFEKVTSRRNLELAWRRVTTGSNLQYKRFLRPLYYPYEIGLKKNLDDLHDRLVGGAYHPQRPKKTYLPKPSGLQRPLTILCLEDQIILQAIANEFARKHRKKRRQLELRSVFSNVLNPEPNNKFFVKNWHYTYHRFTEQIKQYYSRGYTWIADFDIAAFYDTISHDLLLRTGFSATQGAEPDNPIGEYFKTWSSERASDAVEHGIPQGPIASDFLAECFLLPIDLELSKHFHYVRFVDDIRVFARTEKEVRKATMTLELLCRQRGLIPQGSKYGIKEASSLKEALGNLPSVGSPDDEEDEERISTSDAERLFKSSLAGRPLRIEDKSRARYVLFRARPSGRLLNLVLKLLARHPEHIDAFVHFLSQYRRSKRIIRDCREYLLSTPYEYVQGEMWHVLARMMSRNEMRSLVETAVDVTKNKKSSLVLKWGALHFLCKADRVGLGNYSKLLRYQDSSLLQGLVVPVLPIQRFGDAGFMQQLLKRSSPEAGIMLADAFVENGKSLDDVGLTQEDLPSQVVNVFEAIGLIEPQDHNVDPMSEILKKRYTVPKWKKWRPLLDNNYGHALQLLATGDPVFFSGRSRWLQYQNSFNHAIVVAIQNILNQQNMPGRMALSKPNGDLIPYGFLLDRYQPFRRAYPRMVDVFRQMNDRRNTLPGSHPYATKTGNQTRHLAVDEQRRFLQGLHHAYADLIDNFNALLT